MSGVLSENILKWYLVSPFSSWLLFLPDMMSRQTLANQAGEEQSCLPLFWSSPTSNFVQSLMAFRLEEWQGGGRLCCRREKAWAPKCHCLLLSYWPCIWEVEESSCLGFCFCGSAGLEIDPAGKPPGQLLGYLQYWVRYTATHCLVRGGALILIFNESLRTKLLLRKVLKFTFSC